jgi:hypothetical protein
MIKLFIIFTRIFSAGFFCARGSSENIFKFSTQTAVKCNGFPPNTGKNEPCEALFDQLAKSPKYSTVYYIFMTGPSL